MKTEKRERITMKVTIFIETYPSNVTTDVLTANEMKTWKMKTTKNKGTYFSYETDKTICEVHNAFANNGHSLDDFVSVTFEKTKEN
jgi:hypothetical protein